MKLLTLFLLLVTAALSAFGATLEVNPCTTEVKCLQNDYKEYVKCLEKRRVKRQTCSGQTPALIQTVPQLISSCNTPNCNVVQNVQPCYGAASYCECIYSCSASCSGYRCGDRCDRSCPVYTAPPPPQIIYQTVQPTPPPVVQSNEVELLVQGPTIIKEKTTEIRSVSPNVTTHIHLTNIVNNTNIVHAPTNINNTNINTVDLGTNSTGNISPDKLRQDINETTDERCCVVVQPRVCEKVNSSRGGVRCVHRKHHTCGEECISDTIHALVRQPCNGPPSVCPPQVAYIPQPQPRCSYQPTWPYVSCGNRPSSCGGCYDHYGYGFQQYYGASQPSCGGCYDDGYQPGSLYRQGPFYQPGYYHMPPVYYVPQPTFQNYCGCCGCFGNDRVDPAFGAPSYSPYGPSPLYYPPQNVSQSDNMQPSWSQLPQYSMNLPCFLPPYYQPQQCPASFFPPPPMNLPFPYSELGVVDPSAPIGPPVPNPQPPNPPVTEKPAKWPSLGVAEQ